MGVSPQRANINDAFEPYLSAKDSQKKIIADASLTKLLTYVTWTPDPNLSLLERVAEIQKVYTITNTLLSDLENVLIYSVADGTQLTASQLAAYRATVDGYQSQYSGISGGLVAYINAAQAFLSTFEKERLSREKTLVSTKEASDDALALAKQTYETLGKT